MNETVCVQKYFYVLIFKISSIRRGAALRDGDQGNPNLEGGSIPSRFSVVARLVSVVLRSQISLYIPSDINNTANWCSAMTATSRPMTRALNLRLEAAHGLPSTSRIWRHPPPRLAVAFAMHVALLWCAVKIPEAKIITLYVYYLTSIC